MAFGLFDISVAIAPLVVIITALVHHLPSALSMHRSIVLSGGALR